MIQDNKTKIFLGVLGGVVVLVLVLIFFVPKESITFNDGGKYNEFAQCLKDSGATFYGAFWCPHCSEQKKMFGSAVDLIPYVECSNPNGQGQTQFCAEKNIEGYPTWEFADGSRVGNKLSFIELSEKTGCQLPDSDPVVSQEEVNLDPEANKIENIENSEIKKETGIE